MVPPYFLCTNDVQGVKYMRISLFLFQPDFLDFLDLGFFCFLYCVVWARARVSRISVSEGDAFISKEIYAESDLAHS